VKGFDLDLPILQYTIDDGLKPAWLTGAGAEEAVGSAASAQVSSIGTVEQHRRI
jgi:hypothetical protein